jgi:hypothetical protein
MGGKCILQFLSVIGLAEEGRHVVVFAKTHPMISGKWREEKYVD